MSERSVEVNIISGQDLKNVASLGTMSPYVEVTFTNCYRSGRTPTAKHAGSSPAWGCKLTFRLSDAQLHQEGAAMLLTVKHAGTLGEVLVGKASVPLADFVSRGTGKPQFAAYQVFRPSGKGHGYLNVSLKVDNGVPSAAAAPDKAGEQRLPFPSMAFPPAPALPSYGTPPAPYMAAPPTAPSQSNSGHMGGYLPPGAVPGFPGPAPPMATGHPMPPQGYHQGYYAPPPGAQPPAQAGYQAAPSQARPGESKPGKDGKPGKEGNGAAASSSGASEPMMAYPMGHPGAPPPAPSAGAGGGAYYQPPPPGYYPGAQGGHGGYYPPPPSYGAPPPRGYYPQSSGAPPPYYAPAPYPVAAQRPQQQYGRPGGGGGFGGGSGLLLGLGAGLLGGLLIDDILD